MKYYRCQVRYSEQGQAKSVVHSEYATSAIDAGVRIAKAMESSVVVFNINQHDQFILQTKDILNVAVIAGE